MTHSSHLLDRKENRNRKLSHPRSVLQLGHKLREFECGFQLDVKVLDFEVLFFSSELGIVIEVSGYPRVTICNTIHEMKRDDRLASWGYEVLRFHIRDIRENQKLVLEAISDSIERKRS